MEKNKNIAPILIIVIFATIFAATSIKIYNTHLDNEYKVITKKICESAQKCFIDKKCEGASVKISTLIRDNYLDKIVDPKTKEYVNGDIVVHYDDEVCKVDIKQ